MARRDTTLVHRGEIAAFVSDHGTLTGLTDDDHTQYHNDARGDARYYTQTLLDAGQLDTRYYTETELDAGQLDTRYYTEAEVDALIGAIPSLANVQDDGSAAELLWAGSDVVLETISAQGVKVMSTTNNPQIRFWSNAADLRGIVYYDDATNQMVLDARETTDSGFRIDHTGTSVLQTAIESDGTQTLFYYGAETEAVARTVSYGLQLRRGNGTGTPVLELYGPATGNSSINFTQTTSTRAQIQFDHATELYFRTVQTGIGFRFYNDADGDLFNIVSNGVEVRPATAANGHVYVYDQNAEYGMIRKLDAGETQLYGAEHGANVEIIAEDALGTAQNLFEGDPDGAVDLYYDGSVALSTQTNGIVVTGNAVANQSEIEMWDATALVGAIVESGGNFTVYSNVNSSVVRLRGKTSGGANQLLFEGDPDVGVGFNGAGPQTAQTYTVTNRTTDRTYDANSTTVAELADVLGTLILDLQNYGLLA